MEVEGENSALSAAIDVFAFQPILRRAKNQRTAELQILIGGIGIGTIPVAIVQFRTLSEPFGFLGSSYETSVYTLGGLRLTSTGLIVLGCALILTLAISFWLKNTSHGLALRAIGVDSETAELMGVKRRQLSLLTMAVSGGLAGLAGMNQVQGAVTSGFNQHIDAGFGFDAITVALLGRSRAWGTSGQ